MVKSCDEAIAHILGLGETERKIMQALCKAPARIKELAATCKKTPGRIQQSLDSLTKRKLVRREKHCLKRGYSYIYYSIGREELKQLARQTLQRRTHTLIQKLS